jgi:flagella basal body P-ring formation protein FlgA
MIRIIVTFLLVLMTVAAAAATEPAQSSPAERPKLKAEAVVTGELVRIGDLVEHAGLVADVAIFRAPDLGTTGTVSTSAVLEAVRRHALVGLDTDGLDQVTVTRASRTIAPAEIEDCVLKALTKQFGLKTENIALNFDGGLRPLQVPPTAEGETRVAQMSYDPRTGRFQANLTVPTGPSTDAPLHLAGRATVTVEVATLAHAVARGAVLKDADVLLERRPRAQVGADAITDSSQAIGLAARTTLEAGRPLRSAQLMKPELVKRSEQVTLVYAVPGITLTVRGKAMESGAEGDSISVLNDQSKRTLQGTVVGPARVAVSNGLPQLADNRRTVESATNDEAH